MDDTRDPIAWMREEMPIKPSLPEDRLAAFAAAAWMVLMCVLPVVLVVKVMQWAVGI